MSSRLTMVFAIVLFGTAMLVAYLGVMLSRSPEAPVAVEPSVSAPALEQDGEGGDGRELAGTLQERLDKEMRVPVVVLARDVKAMARLVDGDLEIEQLKLAPPGSYSDPEELLGQVAWRDLAAGTVLNEASFAIGGPLAKMIRPGERALAIEVDEVTALGGHLQPGDYVDALLYLRQDERNADRTAQVVIPALRVLSVGAQLGASTEGEPLMPPAPDEDERRARSAQSQAPRSVVLAVPDVLQSRFYLASRVGSLRLSLRSQDEKLLAAYWSGKKPDTEVAELERQLFQFEKLALRQAASKHPGLVAPRAPSIPVYSGATLTRHTPK